MAQKETLDLLVQLVLLARMAEKEIQEEQVQLEIQVLLAKQEQREKEVHLVLVVLVDLMVLMEDLELLVCENLVVRNFIIVR